MAATKVTTILDLPRELRDTIYDYALADATIAINKYVEPALIHTCRLFRAEAMKPYYVALQAAQAHLKRRISWGELLGWESHWQREPGNVLHKMRYAQKQVVVFLDLLKQMLEQRELAVD